MNKKNNNCASMEGRIDSGRLAMLASLMLLPVGVASAEALDDSTMEIYGHVMVDMGYEDTQSDPDWFDVLRPTKLPAFDKQFGEDGEFFAGVRQSRLGVKTSTPSSLGEIKTWFEFEMFGTGNNAGETTFRLRHAYGELGHFGAGQTWSPFMDVDLLPNTLEYWGPTGMALFRNTQLRWMPIQGDTRLTFALERPGASADQGPYANRVELQNVSARFPYPDLSGEFRLGTGFGYVEIAGLVRYLKWDDRLPDAFQLGDSKVGWGVNLSSNVKLGDNVLRLGVVYGEGIQNYMNDAPADVGVRNNFSNPTRPIEGELLPVLGVTAFFDWNWSEKLTSSIGYSFVDIDNSSGQTPDAFHKGEYALANVLFHPVGNVLFGPEIQWGRRENARDGFSVDTLRLQFSVRYKFSHSLGGG